MINQGESKRIALLDVLRGVAILGTLGTNVWVFMDPQGLVGLLTGSGSALAMALTNGKSLAMLTMLFGVGVEIQRRSFARKGARWPGRYLWRATLLLVDGVVHYVLVTEVDVLMAYAVTSMAVAYVVGTSERAQRVWLVAAGTVHLAFVTLATLALSGGGDGGPPPPRVTVYTDGGYADQVLYRLAQWPVLRAESIFILPYATCLFLVGAWLFRAGVFGEEGRRIRDRLMWIGLGVGVPLNVVTATSGLFLVDRYVVPPLVALGIIGLAGRVFRTGGTWFANVGRMSLSCYMLQNIVAMVVCFGWGFGLAGVAEHRPLWTLALWVGISALMMAFSAWWLRRFPHGPVETAWRWAYQAPRRRPVTVRS